MEVSIPTCFKACRKCFCVAVAILLRRFQKMGCIFRGKRSTLETSDVILRGTRSALDVWRCEFSANRIVRAASNGENVQIPWKVWHFRTSDENRSVMSGVSPKSVSLECFPKSVMPRVSPKNVFPRGSFQECHAKSVSKECHVRSVVPRVSSQEGLSECHAKVARVSCQE